MDGLELTMVLASALLHATWSASIKSSAEPLAFNALQGCISAVVGGALAFALVDWRAIPADLWWILAGTSVSHAIYSVSMGLSFRRADLTLAYPIIRSTPALLPFVAVPLLGDRITWAGALGIAVVVAGAWTVQAQPGLGWRSLRQPGVPAAFLTLAATVGYALFDKAGVARLADSSVAGVLGVSLAWFCLLSAGHALLVVPLAAALLPRGAFAAVARAEWRRALGALGISVLGYGLILQAYQTAPASYVVAVRQTSVLFAVGIAMLWLGEQPSRRRVLGAAATVVGVAAIALGG